MDNKANVAIAQRIANREGFYTLAQDPAYTGIAFRVRAATGMTPLDMMLRGYERETIAGHVMRYGG